MVTLNAASAASCTHFMGMRLVIYLFLCYAIHLEKRCQTGFLSFICFISSKIFSFNGAKYGVE